MKHIRIVSPSGAIDPAYLDGAAERLRAWGYRVSEAPHARACWGRFAGTDDERAADLLDALCDPDVDVLLCSRGGYGLQRIIDRLDRALQPHLAAGGRLPLVAGFSDITALHRLMNRCGQVSLHGIMCKHIATLPETAEPLVQWRQAIEGEPLSYTLPWHPLNRWQCGLTEVHGMLLGGNLSVLYGLQGTTYALPTNGARCILLLEDIGERHYHIDRMMRNLRMSGVLANLQALLVGQFTDCDDDPAMRVARRDTQATVYETILESVQDYTYPVLFNIPCGHVEHNLPFRLGRPARLSFSERSSQSLAYLTS